MTNYELIEHAKRAVGKTTYAMGGLMYCASDKNKERVLKHSYNTKTTVRKARIQNTPAKYILADCVGFVKGLINGALTTDKDFGKYMSGATYNKVIPDVSIRLLLTKHCIEVSDDWSKEPEVGEFVVLSDSYSHCGLYAGDGMVIECTPKWENIWGKGVAITNKRKWKYHGKIKYIEYLKSEPEAPKIKKGDKVRIKDGATNIAGKKLMIYCYIRDYEVIEAHEKEDRYVIGIGGVVTAAMHKDSLILLDK